MGQRQQGTERQVFEEQALPHLDAMYGMALRLTQDERDAEDLVQDSMVKAFRFFHRYQEGSNIKAWLFKVLVNTFYNTRRKTKNTQRLHSDAEAGSHHERFISEASTAAQHSNAEEVLLDKLVVEKLQEAMNELPKGFRLAVLLCDVYGFSYKEIAEIIERPVGTVMSRLHRGRRLLQKRLYDVAVEQGYIQPPETGPQTEEQLTDLEAYRRRRGQP
jgi:RNA polymerase sigma-70 factor (ECF subfamily)